MCLCSRRCLMRMGSCMNQVDCSQEPHCANTHWDIIHRLHSLNLPTISIYKFFYHSLPPSFLHITPSTTSGLCLCALLFSNKLLYLRCETAPLVSLYFVHLPLLVRFTPHSTTRKNLKLTAVNKDLKLPRLHFLPICLTLLA